MHLCPISQSPTPVCGHPLALLPQRSTCTRSFSSVLACPSSTRASAKMEDRWFSGGGSWPRSVSLLNSKQACESEQDHGLKMFKLREFCNKRQADVHASHTYIQALCNSSQARVVSQYFVARIFCCHWPRWHLFLFLYSLVMCAGKLVCILIG